MLMVFLLTAAIGAQQTAGPAGKPVHRALLVGISKYQLSETNKSFGALPASLNDVEIIDSLLKSPGYGFQTRRLTDLEATRSRILSEIEKFLIDGAAPGDVSVFYFTGHGSQIRNSLNGESDQREETLVPADVVRPIAGIADIRDIRDRELNALLKKAVRKGVTITAIIDSCNSGSIGRDGEQLRQLDPVTNIDLNEQPTAEDKIKAGDIGALIISAAKDFEKASSAPYPALGLGEEKTFGNLTANLVMALYHSPASGISADDLMKQVSARIMRQQNPSIDGNEDRRQRTIFGQAVQTTPPRMAVAKDNRGKFFLVGGRAEGLLRGSQLKRADANKKEAWINLTQVGLSRSEFEVVGPDTAPELSEGDLFQVESWGVSEEPFLTTWLPQPVAAGQLEKIRTRATAFAADKRIAIADSPEAASHILIMDGAEGCEINGPGGRRSLKPCTPSALETEIGAAKDKMRLFVSLPPTAEIADKLQFGAGVAYRSPIARSKLRDGAQYMLVGRTRMVGGKTETEYAWALTAGGEANVKGGAKVINSLPRISQWISAASSDAASRLAKEAQTLARIRGWLTLNPQADAAKTFPYRLEVRDPRIGAKLAEGDDLVEGVKYQMFLVGDPQWLRRGVEEGAIAQEFFVYVINIDRVGLTGLVFPKDSSKPQRIKITGLEATKEVLLDLPLEMCDAIEPNCRYGTENFVVLMTDKQLSDLTLANINSPGVAPRGTRGGGRPLDAILFDIGSETISRDSISSPDNWYSHRLVFYSRKKE